MGYVVGSYRGSQVASLMVHLVYITEKRGNTEVVYSDVTVNIICLKFNSGLTLVQHSALMKDLNKVRLIDQLM